MNHDPLTLPAAERRPVDILLPTPASGGKIWLLERKGLFVLERCPGTLRTLAVTHAGAGGIEAIDGIPDDNGHFPDDHMAEPEMPTPFPIEGGAEVIRAYVKARQAYDCRNGRAIYQATQAVMGSWMLDGGFMYGLCIRALSGHSSSSVVASVVWMPRPERKTVPQVGAGGVLATPR